jgi:3-vinyl bacteriochlorophyllide hydratase
MPHLKQILLTDKPLYTPEQQLHRDQTYWTLVQGVLAPLQFLVFIVSAALIVRFTFTGQGFEIAALSVVIKTIVLYMIMVTGALWEKHVFGVYLFAPAFFWEDAVSIAVLILHTWYLWAWSTHSLNKQDLLGLAIAAYGFYLVNALQFLWKFRCARISRNRFAFQSRQPEVAR